MSKLLVGITGGIGAGKTSLATFYREAGYPVFSADEIAREIVGVGQPALAEIAALFGASALAADGTLNRAAVRSQIAADPSLRLRLEAITHPRIQARSLELAKAAFAGGAEIVFYEAPLLFEAKSDRAMDKVICVHAPDSIRVDRVVARDRTSRAEAEKLLASQMPQAEKMKRSDFLVENSGDKAALKAQAAAVLAKLLKK